MYQNSAIISNRKTVICSGAVESLHEKRYYLKKVCNLMPTNHFLVGFMYAFAFSTIAKFIYLDES